MRMLPFICALLLPGLCALLVGCRTTSSPPPSPLLALPDGPLAAQTEHSGSDSTSGDIALASFQAPLELPENIPVQQEVPEVLPPPDSSRRTTTAAGSGSPAEPLRLDQVLTSLERSYPLLMVALAERQVTAGKQLGAWGEFDLNLTAYSIATPESFYENYRNIVTLEQPLFEGGYLYGGYKLGRGSFPPWYGERETDDGGEFSVGVGTPLLKGRAIDERRSELFQAELARAAADPAAQSQLLEFARLASQAYWDWVAAGRAVEAQRELLRNAEARVQQIQQRVEAGDLEVIARINNEQLIASREAKVVETARKLQQSAIKLSLFYRNAAGEPNIPSESQLPNGFPVAETLPPEQLESDVAEAIAASPMLQELGFAADAVRIEMQYAENMLLPKLDFRLVAAKDVGEQASSKGDKTPFELEAGFYAEVPLQRREARGKLLAAQGKLAQINAKRQFVAEKLEAAIYDAFSALEAARRRIELSQQNLRLAREALELGNAQFTAGDITLVELNIYEKSVTEAELVLIESQADFWLAVADYQAALSRIGNLAQVPSAED